MLGSSLSVPLVLVVFAHSAAEVDLNVASSISVFTRDLIAPWATTLGHLGDSYVKARLPAEIQRQASMVCYINAFHLMSLVPFLTAPLAFLFVTGRPGER